MGQYAVGNIGRFQILNEVGRGAMGVVYRAEDPAIGRIIAIKTIRLTDLTDPEERQRLRDRLFREARVAGVLSHPNIVTIYDIAEENGQACIYMEFVNGPSLESLMSAPAPPEKQTILNIFRHTATALDYAHRKGIVHRDIKPANIILDEDGQAKITDFGVAKIISHQLTQSGSMMGTPNYMSPEQVQGAAVDGRADQFALAVIAYELLTGEKPFAGDHLPALLFQIVKEEPTAPERLNPAVGPYIQEVLGIALAKNPAERYGTCGEFVEALTQACAATPGWVPVARGSTQSMPTLAVAAPQPEPPPARPPLSVPPRPVRVEPEEEAPKKRPLFATIAWVLAGIGIVGLILLGAQKLFLESPEEPSGQVSAAAPGARSPVPDKPSPAATGTQPAAVELPADTAPPPERRGEDGRAQPAGAAPVADVAAKRNGEQSLQLLTDPPGATVTVDGTAASCKTPCMLSVGAGRHVLNAQLAGFRPYPRIVNVPQDSDVFMKMAKSVGTLGLTSSPEGASIQINGEERPQKTPATFALPPGEYQVRVVREGVPLEFTIQIKDGEFQTRNVSFQ